VTTYLDQCLFAVFPYVAMAVFFVGTIWRYRTQMYSYTTMSSQFLENRQHFWGMMAFHYGIIGTLAGHVIAFLVPKSVLWWNGAPLRLYLLEATAFIFGALALLGMAIIVYRRLTDPRVKVVTTAADKLIYVVVLAILLSGVSVAIFHGWGTSWFAASVTPYLWSLIKFHPQLDTIMTLPLAFKVHVVSAFTLITILPFTKLVHILVAPNQYMFRKNQVVRWYGYQ
jgi:nitrate reductase gamma subunit